MIVNDVKKMIFVQVEGQIITVTANFPSTNYAIIFRPERVMCIQSIAMRTAKVWQTWHRQTDNKRRKKTLLSHRSMSLMSRSSFRINLLTVFFFFCIQNHLFMITENLIFRHYSVL